MGKQEAYKKMFEAVEDGDTDSLLTAINEVIDEADPLEIIQNRMMPGLKHIDELFGEGEVLLPEMLMAAETFQEGMKIIEPRLTETGRELKKGKIIRRFQVGSYYQKVGTYSS